MSATTQRTVRQLADRIRAVATSLDKLVADDAAPYTLDSIGASLLVAARRLNAVTTDAGNVGDAYLGVQS